ncbi:MAG: ssuD2, partial [Mycobacterium sp.]|nr:ssuD2 [Mycobacterium sp.]
FLPTGGDGRRLGGTVHGAGIGIRAGDRTAGTMRVEGQRDASLDYLAQIARAADSLGYEGVLTPTGAHCEDAWIVTAALMAQTKRLKFLVAFRPGLVEPALAAHMASTFQHLSQGRLLLNVVSGGSDAEQRAYGDWLSHDERYERAGEFLDIVRECWSGEELSYTGKHYRVEGAALRQPLVPTPKVYFGGSSDPALQLASCHADVYLSWGEPVAQAAEKIDQVRKLAADAGREVRFGLRIHVITRDTAQQAWAAADALIAGLSDDEIALGQKRLRSVESVGQRRMLDLHGGSRDNLLVAPNLWAGVGLVRGGAGTALVGSHDEVAERITEYHDAGFDEFILSGYPHLEEAYSFGEGVIPLLTAASTAKEIVSYD